MKGGSRAPLGIILRDTAGLIAVFFVVNTVTGVYSWVPERTLGALFAPNLAAFVAVAYGLALSRVEPRFRRVGSWVFAAFAGVFIGVALGETVTQVNFQRGLDPVQDLRFMAGVAQLLFDVTGETARFAAYAIFVVGSVALLALGLLGAFLLRFVFRHFKPHPIAFPLWAAYIVLALAVFGPTYTLSWSVARGIAAPTAVEDFVAYELDAVPGSNPAYAFPAIADADIHVFLVESYGHTVFSNDVVRAGLYDFLREQGEQIERAGYSIVSHFIEAPIVGGYSWIAQATLFTGQRVSSQAGVERVMSTPRTTLFSIFNDAQYHTVFSMPGTVNASWTEGEQFYGFDTILYAWDFGYSGPSFSFVPVPDQFSIDFVHRKMAERRRGGDETPALIVQGLVSSHGPFNRIPPYLDDWDLLGDGTIYHDLEIETFDNDWFSGTQWDEGYIASIRYVMKTITEYITRFVDDDDVIVILGDHQPGQQVRPRGDLFSVPIHYISRNHSVGERLLAEGFQPGIIPTQDPPHPGMETFLSQLLLAIGRPIRTTPEIAE